MVCFCDPTNSGCTCCFAFCRASAAFKPYPRFLRYHLPLAPLRLRLIRKVRRVGRVVPTPCVPWLRAAPGLRAVGLVAGFAFFLISPFVTGLFENPGPQPGWLSARVRCRLNPTHIDELMSQLTSSGYNKSAPLEGLEAVSSRPHKKRLAALPAVSSKDGKLFHSPTAFCFICRLCFSKAA